MKKGELRTQFLAKRKALSTEEVEHRSLAAGALLYDNFIATRSPTYIHTFLPIIRQKEVNTWPIIHRIWQERPEINIVVSVTDTVSHSLAAYELTPQTTLAENRWGIPEPVNSEQRRSDGSAVSSELFDLVLVPLLAFDWHGHRVGYGGGYYDRFLAHCRSDCLKIGLSLFEPVDVIDDVEVTDVRLDYCVSSSEIYAFV